LSQLFEELKRRNVFRVAIAYLALAWLIIQVADIVLGYTSAPAWVMQVLMLFVAIGFPLAVFFAWAFEMTPEGIKREHEVDRERSITGETGRKLNRTITVVLVAAVAFLLADKFLLRDEAPAEPATADLSVAVLPFVSMSSGPDDEFFADGLTEEILNSLARLPELLVTARTSAFHFKGKDIPIPEIAATLGVAHVVEGSVRRSGDQMRVTAQLIRAADGFHLWSETYDHETSDAFGVQTDIAEKIATALDVVLDEEQLELMRSFGIRDPEAFVAWQRGFDLYLQAHASWSVTEKLREANEWLEKSLALHPENAAAHALHSDLAAHSLMEASAGQPISEEDLNKALADFTSDMDNAIKYAPDEVTGLAARFDKKIILGDWRGVTTLLDEIARARTCVWPSWDDMVSITFGKEQLFLDQALRKIECDPLNFSGWRAQVQSLAWLGDYQAAIAAGLRGLEVLPHDAIRHELAKTYLLAGDLDAAKAIIDRGMEDESMILDLRVRVAAAQGDGDKARSLVAEMLETDFAEQMQGVMISMHSITGQQDQANSLAAEADARPLGHLILMVLPLDCQCGAPFDLEYTPNFAKMLDDAELPWPPKTLGDWPLRDDST
jgi:TolB-like protein